MVQDSLTPPQEDVEDFAAGGPEPFQITINDIQYPCEKWETVGAARALKRDWEQGWAGGMGTLTNVGDDSYYVANNMDLSTPPYARLRPRYEATISLTSGGAEATYGFIATDGSWNFLYVLSGRYSQKIAMETNGATWTKWEIPETKDFGAGAVVGRPAFFEGVWHVPLGPNVDATRLATVATPDDVPSTVLDTWTALSGNTDDTALAFAVSMIEGVAQLWRAFDTNKVSTTAAIGTAFAPTAGFEVGDSGEAIVDAMVLEGNIVWSKPSSPFWFDDQGNNFAYQSFVSRGATLTDTDGVNMTSHGPYGYWPHSSGLWRLYGGNALPVGPMSDPLWTGFGLDGIVPTFYSEWNSATAWERWIYATTQEKLFHGWIRADGTIHWHGMLATTAGTTTRAFIVSNPVTAATGPLLCLLESGTNLNIMQLEPRGSTRRIMATTSGLRGAASENGQFWLPFTTMGAPLEMQKQLRMIWVTVENMPASDTVTLTVRADRDRTGTTVQVGSGVTTAGTGTYEFVWTPGTSDTFREVMVSAKLAAGASYDPSAANSDPRIRAIGMRAATPHTYKATIPVTPEGMRGRSLGVKDALKKLRDLKSSEGVNVREPTFNSTFTGYVKDVAEKVISAQDGSIGYAIEVTVDRWVL